MKSDVEKDLVKITEARVRALRKEGFDCRNLIATSVPATGEAPFSPESRVLSASPPFVVAVIYYGPTNAGRRGKISFEVQSLETDTAERFFTVLHHWLQAPVRTARSNPFIGAGG